MSKLMILTFFPIVSHNNKTAGVTSGVDERTYIILLNFSYEPNTVCSPQARHTLDNDCEG